MTILTDKNPPDFPPPPPPPPPPPIPQVNKSDDSDAADLLLLRLPLLSPEWALMFPKLLSRRIDEEYPGEKAFDWVTVDNGNNCK